PAPSRCDCPPLLALPDRPSRLGGGQPFSFCENARETCQSLLTELFQSPTNSLCGTESRHASYARTRTHRVDRDLNIRLSVLRCIDGRQQADPDTRTRFNNALSLFPFPIQATAKFLRFCRRLLSRQYRLPIMTERI